MASDLQIASITLPATVTAPCPTRIPVDVINRGADPANIGAPMTVCLEVRAGDFADHYSLQTAPEGPPIKPGEVRRFVFEVQLPCRSSVTLTATADCGQTVVDNLRTDPSLTVAVPSVRLVPWLMTDVRVGLRDSTGYVNWAPLACCPNAELVAEATIHNAGCAAAVASVTKLSLLDDAGNSLATSDQPTPPIAPGASTLVRFAIPAPPGVGGANLTVRVCADDTAVVVGQCDRRRACGQVTMPLAVGAGPPALTLEVARPVFPGEPVPISWSVQNFCTDLGAVTARIVFQGGGLYAGIPMHVGLQDVPRGESLTLKPAVSAAPDFYRIGAKQVTLELTGTGTDPGPYTATATVTVIPEPTPGAWTFTLPTPGSTIAWKTPYTVAGRVANPTHAMMTPTSVVLNETSMVTQPTQRQAAPLLGPVAQGGSGLQTWSLTQAWTWLVPGVWLQKASLGSRFDYDVTLLLQDEFGNAYPSVTSGQLSVTVAVSTQKIALQTTAQFLADCAFTLLALAFLALANWYTAIGAPILFAAAGAAATASAGAGAGALDPPVADFDYGRAVAIGLPGSRRDVGDTRVLVELDAVFALLDRALALGAGMSVTEGKLIGARIDAATAALQLQTTAFVELRDRLLLSTEQIPAAVQRVIETEQESPQLRVPDTAEARSAIDEWRSTGLPRGLRQRARAAGVAAPLLADFESALRSPDVEIRAIEGPLGDLQQAAAAMGVAVAEYAEGVLVWPAER